MNEVRWKLKTFPGKVKPRTGYVLERMVPPPNLMGVPHPIWEVVPIENTSETLVFDQYPLGQAVPKIMDISELMVVEEED
jgi:hypothetical protein